MVAVELFGAQQLVLGTDDGMSKATVAPTFIYESDMVGLVVDAPSSQVSCLREAKVSDALTLRQKG